MHPEEPDQSLQVVVNESVVEFRVGLFRGAGNNTMSRQKIEIDASRFSQRSRVNSQAPKITNDEPEQIPGLDVEPCEDVLRMGFKCHAIVDQWW